MLYSLLSLFNLLTGEGTGADTGAGAGDGGGDPNTGGLPDWFPLVIFAVFAVIMVVYYFINKKRAQKAADADAEKKSQLCKGTKIITVGGIIGVVVSVDQEEKTFVLETEGSVMKFDMRAIYQMELPKGKEKA